MSEETEMVYWRRKAKEYYDALQGIELAKSDVETLSREFAESLRKRDKRITKLWAVVDVATCARCNNEATCIGEYEGHGGEQLACDTCCGHGNEDGYCEPIPLAVPEGKAADRSLDRLKDAHEEKDKRIAALEAERDKLQGRCNTYSESADALDVFDTKREKEISKLRAVVDAARDLISACEIDHDSYPQLEKALVALAVTEVNADE